MADKKKNNAVPELDPTAKALVKGVDDVVGDTVPKQAKDFLGVFIGMLAQKASNWIGTASRNVSLKIASKYTDNAQRAHQISAVSDMAGRSLITTILPNVMPAWKLIQETRKNRSQVKDDFALLLKTEGKGNTWLGGTQSDLEVVNYQLKLNADANGIRTKSFFKKLFSETVTDAVVNAPSMMITEVEKYTEYKSLVALREKQSGRLEYKDQKQLNILEKERSSRGAEANALRDEAAKKSLSWLEKKLPFIPDENGFNDSQSAMYNQFATLIGSGGDFTEGRGRGRASFLSFMRDTVGYSYKAFLAPKVSTLFGSKAAPNADKMLAHISAAKMIKSLEAPFKDHASPSRVTLLGASEKNCLVGDYVYDIFARHRADMGLAELSELNKERLREACDVIAAAMQDGNRRLHPQALAYLVDSKRGIMTQAAGKGVEVKQGEELEKMIQSLISDKGLTGKPAIKAEEYYQSESRGGGGMVRFTRAEMQTSWNNLSEEEQQLWSTNFPDAVLVDITGNKDYARSLRMKHNDCWQEMFEETTLAIHNLSQRELQQAGITAGMQKELAELNRELKRDTKNALYDNQARVMDLTAEICVRMDTAHEGFLSKVIANATQRKAKKEGFDHELEGHAEESYHFRNKVDERSREEVKEPREPREHAKDKIIKSRRHSHDEVGEEAGYHGRY